MANEIKGGFGAVMTTEQFKILTEKLNVLTGETERREEAVAQSLHELKRIEGVRTYAQFVKDITTSIQTLSMMENTEHAREQLLSSLTLATNNFHISKGLPTYEEQKELATKSSLSFKAECKTTESPTKPSVQSSLVKNLVKEK